jgi:type IV pilus biogenesis protein CpaD/CtpE
MRKALAVLAAALLAGCMSAPMSSVHDRARPSHMIENGDGTTTFEFLFPYDDAWDRNMAMQRINEYLATYARVNGLSGFDTISAATQLISKIGSASVALDLVADAARAASGETSAPEQARFVRVIDQVKFRQSN